MNNFVGHLTKKNIKGNTEQQDLTSKLTSLNMTGKENMEKSLAGNITEREILGNTKQKEIQVLYNKVIYRDEIQISIEEPTNSHIKLWYQIDS